MFSTKRCGRKVGVGSGQNVLWQTDSGGSNRDSWWWLCPCCPSSKECGRYNQALLFKLGARKPVPVRRVWWKDATYSGHFRWFLVTSIIDLILPRRMCCFYLIIYCAVSPARLLVPLQSLLDSCNGSCIVAAIILRSICNKRKVWWKSYSILVGNR